MEEKQEKNILSKINEFRKEFMGEYYFPIAEEDLEEMKSQPNVWFIELKEEIVALAIVSFVISLTRRTLTIEDFIVDKNYRKQGYGKRLMQQIIDFAKSKYIHCIDISCKKENYPARRLYEKMGFKNRKQVSYRLWLKPDWGKLLREHENRSS